MSLNQESRFLSLDDLLFAEATSVRSPSFSGSSTSPSWPSSVVIVPPVSARETGGGTFFNAPLSARKCCFSENAGLNPSAPKTGVRPPEDLLFWCPDWGGFGWYSRSFSMTQRAFSTFLMRSLYAVLWKENADEIGVS